MEYPHLRFELGLSEDPSEINRNLINSKSCETLLLLKKIDNKHFCGFLARKLNDKAFQLVTSGDQSPKFGHIEGVPTIIVSSGKTIRNRENVTDLLKVLVTAVIDILYSKDQTTRPKIHYDKLCEELLQF